MVKACPEPPHFAGTSTSAIANENLEIETDFENKIIAIRKSDDCYEIVYDIEKRRTTLSSKTSTYKSVYSHSSQVLSETQHVSEWFTWERETRVGQM